MTALYITLGVIAGIFLLIYILLRISVCACISASDERLDISVKYSWFELYKLEKSFKSDEKTEILLEDIEKGDLKSSKTDESAKAIKDKPAAETKHDEEAPGDDELFGKPDDEKPKKSVKEIIDEYKPYLPVAKKALRKLLKMIRFYDLDLSLTVGDEDAYKAAMKFGKINALVYSAIALLCCAFTVSIKHTEINCNFDSSKTYASVATTVKVRPSAVLALAIYLGINYLKIRHNQNEKEKLLNKEKENLNVREEQ